MSPKPENSEKIPAEKAKQQQAAIPAIVILTIYLILLSVLVIHGLIAFWPDASAETNDASFNIVRFLFCSIHVSGELRMILIVIMAGALGSLVHAFRSLFWYVGNKAFVKDWVLMYILLPFIGSSMALVFYFVLRGGLFSPQVSVDSTSPFGFAGVSGLVGMFSNQAGLKLQEVAKSIFRTEGTTQGKDSVPPEGTDPKG
jgi:hypothetical protein